MSGGVVRGPQVTAPIRQQFGEISGVHCGGQGGYAPFGQRACEQIDWQVHLTRIVYRRPTYRRAAHTHLGWDTATRQASCTSG